MNKNPRFSKGTSNPRRNQGKPNENSSQISKTQRWVVGQHAIAEVLKVRPKAIVKAIFQTGWQSLQNQKELSQLLKSKGCPIDEKPKNFLDQIYPNHQGCALIVEGRPQFNYDQLKKNSQIVFLDGIEDPHNLGAICRTSWLLGVEGIFIPENRAVDLTPTVHKVACGGVEHVPITSETHFKNQIDRLKEKGYWVFGLSHKAEKTLLDIKLPNQIVWCIGAEDKGLRTTSEKLCDELVSIPQLSAEASYNASVATAMALFEGYRQTIANHK